MTLDVDRSMTEPPGEIWVWFRIERGESSAFLDRLIAELNGLIVVGQRFGGIWEPMLLVAFESS